MGERMANILLLSSAVEAAIFDPLALFNMHASDRIARRT